MDTLPNDLLRHLLGSIDYNDPAIWQVHLLRVCKRWYAILSTIRYRPLYSTMHRYSTSVVVRFRKSWLKPSRQPVVLTQHFMDKYWYRINWNSLAFCQPIPASHAHRVDWASISRHREVDLVLRYNSEWLQWDAVESDAGLTERSILLALQASQPRICWEHVFSVQRSPWFTLRYGWYSSHGRRVLLKMAAVCTCFSAPVSAMLAVLYFVYNGA